MAGVQDWWDAPEIHPSEIKVGDIIGTTQPSGARCTVRLIGGPQSSPRQWDRMRAGIPTAGSTRARSGKTT